MAGQNVTKEYGDADALPASSTNGHLRAATGDNGPAPDFRRAWRNRPHTRLGAARQGAAAAERGDGTPGKATKAGDRRWRQVGQRRDARPTRAICFAPQWEAPPEKSGNPALLAPEIPLRPVDVPDTICITDRTTERVSATWRARSGKPSASAAQDGHLPTAFGPACLPSRYPYGSARLSNVPAPTRAPTENAMPRKVKSVRVPEELSAIDLSGIIAECEKYLRDLESVAMLNQQGEREAAEALLRARQSDLGRRVGMKVWEARKQAALERLNRSGNPE